MSQNKQAGTGSNSRHQGNPGQQHTHLVYRVGLPTYSTCVNDHESPLAQVACGVTDLVALRVSAEAPGLECGRGVDGLGKDASPLPGLANIENSVPPVVTAEVARCRVQRGDKRAVSAWTSTRGLVRLSLPLFHSVTFRLTLPIDRYCCRVGGNSGCGVGRACVRGHVILFQRVCQVVDRKVPRGSPAASGNERGRAGDGTGRRCRSTSRSRLDSGFRYRWYRHLRSRWRFY